MGSFLLFSILSSDIIRLFLCDKFSSPTIKLIVPQSSRDCKIKGNVFKIATSYVIFYLYGDNLELVKSLKYIPKEDSGTKNDIITKYNLTKEKNRLDVSLEFDKIRWGSVWELEIMFQIQSTNSTKWENIPNYVFEFHGNRSKLNKYISLILIILLYIFSALFSGLNIGLMCLETYELELIVKTGSKKKKKYAEALLPIRKTGNILLCAILIVNTAANAMLTVLSHALIQGVASIAISSFCLVIFAEIIPQSIFSRYALMLGAKTRYITWFIIAITSPLSVPLGLFLNYVLKFKELKSFSRERLEALVKTRSDQTISNIEV
ncbi:Metal transporter CNNM2 [Thelohanellus kitauei]|uniref:Metal transporter CNNM2 n=1 Tax=Thelohanellus kitauei TaxID=669202 RepID=A0A0C2JX32_THEKT|nr:Metal transporter CNNM2 [Thelohanellus kitauei]